MNKLRHHWHLDQEVTFLNHGSFGACPKPVLQTQADLRQRLESEPVRFMVQELPVLREEAKAALGAFIDADEDGLAFVNNATTGVNAVLRSLELTPDDELLCSNHEYNACRNVIEHVAQTTGAQLRIVDIPFPLNDPDEIVDALRQALTQKTKMVLIDHVTSATGLVLPLKELIAESKKHGAMVLVDGAHALGMVPLSISDLGADFYVSNAHKWLCTPKGSAFLWVKEEHRAWVRPTVISHGANCSFEETSRYRWEFDWQGTVDPTPWLCIPKAIEFMGSLIPGGWEGLMKHNHELVIAGRDLILDALGTKAPCPDTMIGSMATIPIGVDSPRAMRDHFDTSPLQRAIYDQHRIQVPFHLFPAPTQWLRISAQAYNAIEEYEKLAQALALELKG